MSQEKAQLIAPLGVMAVEGMNASGVITATSLDGNIVGSAKSLVNGANVSVGVITATSFAGNLTGNIARLADSAPDVDAGVTTATSFVGNLTGSVTDLTSQPAITVGMVTATTLEGPVTGNVTGNVTGIADGLSDGLGVNYNGGWTGAGTSQITAGVVTATTFYGDGSNLDGVSSGPVSQQAVTIDGASTTIDLSNGNLIYASQSADTTVSFANSENGNVYFVRVKDATTTARTITWPDRISWEGGSAPTLITTNSPAEGQVFLLVTRDMGVTWYGKEVVNADLLEGYGLWNTGYNNYGQLGHNNETSYSSPVQLSGNWSILGNANLNYGMAVRNNQTFWTWGRNNYGQLGHNNVTLYSSPVQLPGTTWGYGITGNTASGAGTAMVTKTDGTLWVWGYNGGGQLAQNNIINLSSPTQIPGTWKNEMYSGCQGYGGWAVAIKDNGTIWSWGYGNFGQLGNNYSFGTPTSLYRQSSPIQIGTATDWDQVSGGVNQPLAIKTTGQLWAWGYNNDGELGLNDTPHRSSPCQVGTDTTWSQITNSYLSVQAIKTNGTLWAWGKNEFGQLAQKKKTTHSSTTQIGTGTDWNQVRAGGNSMYANKTDGTMWVWGKNEYGQLGKNQSATLWSSPTQIPGTNWKSANNYGFAAHENGLSILRSS